MNTPAHVWDRLSLNIFAKTQATAADNPVMTTNLPSAPVDNDPSASQVSMKKPPSHQHHSRTDGFNDTDLWEKQSRRKERDIDDVQFPLRGFIRDSSSG
jgi:hypothetical protein